MPLELQNLLNSSEVNSRSLSIQRQHIEFSVSFSTKLLKFLNVTKASDLEFKK